MAFGFHVVPSLLDFAVGADQIRTACDALKRTAHKFLHPPGSVSLNHFVCGIAEQRKIQLLLGLEVGEELRRIRTGAQNHDAGLVKLRACVTKLGRFDRSTWGVRLRKEKQKDALAPEVL